MPFDFTPLTTTQLLLFGAGFVLVYGLIAWLLKIKRPILRRVPASRVADDQQPVYYVGALLIGVVSLISFLIIDDPRLKIGLLAASFLTLFIGILDENNQIKPGIQFVWQLVIATIAVSWGWTIPYVSNISGTGIIDLSNYQLGAFLLPGGLLAIAWLLLLMNAINWLDGVDGLAPGVSTIALITLAAITLLPQIQDQQTLSLALLGAGAVAGLLLWNFPPARVYLGTSGSWFLGLFIGLAAILSGGKIVTTLLVLAIPVVDFVLVAIQRVVSGQAPWHGDTVRHLHHRLLARGLSPRAITAGGIAVSALLGIIAITLQTQQKVITFIIAAAMLTLLLINLIGQRPHHVQ